LREKGQASKWKYKEFALGITESEREEIYVERRDKYNKE
jgi:hypothetical protein